MGLAQRALTIQRLAAAVYHAPEQAFAERKAPGAEAAAAPFAQRQHARAGLQSADFLEGHEKQPLAGKADHLGLGKAAPGLWLAAAGQFDAADAAERNAQAD